MVSIARCLVSCHSCSSAPLLCSISTSICTVHPNEDLAMKTRVVLREDDKLALEQVMAVTGVESYSAAITLLITRYADSLCRWWQSSVHDPPGLPATIADLPIDDPPMLETIDRCANSPDSEEENPTILASSFASPTRPQTTSHPFDL